MIIAKHSYFEIQRQAYLERSQKAANWARLAFWLLALAFFTAVWQDRMLAPALHDGMRVVVHGYQDVIESTDGVRAFVKGLFFRPSGVSVPSEFDPITSWLLRNR